MGKLNLLTQKLLAEGWKKEDTPPLCHPWSDFDGGWAYRHRDIADWVYETPCGLLVRHTYLSHHGSMSYMGVEWTEENDCSVIICPYYRRKEPCELNHPLLRELSAGCHYESLVNCAVHKTDRPYDYEHSVDKVSDMAKAQQKRDWEVYSAKHNGHVCQNQSRYNRSTGEWSSWYDPQACARLGCTYCDVLGRDLERVRGNVFYDIKTMWTVPGVGLLPPEEKTSIQKGVKLLEKAVSLTICEMIVKHSQKAITEHFLMEKHWDMYFDKSLRFELTNFRALRRDVRDIDQDLQDAANGIAVSHQADVKADIKAQKHQRKEAAAEAKIRRLEKTVLQLGPEMSYHDRQRALKFLGQDRVRELLAKREEKVNEEQLSIF